ncbi:helix-turn-helix transcriptional regulator [Kitasatospora sp. NPDC008115]|uniref:helix-turn-helix transcriptional regulator n=1 Tax=Kitasatospora sp. NPDC008115 TaxID=3364022 RepID=UPI0036E89E47
MPVFLLTLVNRGASMAGMGPLSTYELTFVVSGATVDDVHIVDALEDQFDAMLFLGAGVNLLTVAADGAGAVDAAMRIANEIAQAVPGLRLERLDRGLVGVPEIAERSGRSRQNVTQWANGERQATAESFPLPEGTAGRSRAWLWSEVNEWLRHLGLDDGFTYPTRAEMNVIDHLLASPMVKLISDDLPDDEFTEHRTAIRERGDEAFHPGLLQYLVESTATTDEHGRHVVVIAAPEEPARLVMERMGHHEHDVILMTEHESQVIAMVMSQAVPEKPTEVVPVGLNATLREWLILMQKHPNCLFVASSAVPSSKQTATRRGVVLTAAA